MNKKVRKILLAIAVVIIVIWLNNTSIFYNQEKEPLLLAHRGLAQTFDVSTVEADTNTAEIIYEPEHPFLENTIPSMQAAFNHGADVVEFDIQLTKDNQLAVFHDAVLEYRTDGHGRVRDYTMEQLKQLDVGYGYTADQGNTYPFRGKGIGMMPSIQEVLEAFPDQDFLIHLKDEKLETAEVLWSYLNQMPSEQFSRMTVYGDDASIQYLREKSDSLRLMSFSMMKDAMLQYILLGFSGYIPAELHNMELHIPLSYTKFIWGWPHKFIDRMEKANTRVVVVLGDGKWSEGFDSKEHVAQLPRGYPGYVWTNRIDLIGSSN